MADRVPSDEVLKRCLQHQGETGWRTIITLSLTADRWYWLLHLAEVGVSTKRVLYERPPSRMDAAEIASIAIWREDLDNLALAVRANLQDPMLSALTQTQTKGAEHAG